MCYLHPVVPSLPRSYQSALLLHKYPSMAQEIRPLPLPLDTAFLKSHQVSEILLHEYPISFSSQREGQGGLWIEIRESLVSLPKKPEGSEIQPSLVDSIKT